MIPLESVNYETFAPLAGSSFKTQTNIGVVELLLNEVQKLGHKREGALRDPFSLTFLGSQGLRMPQGIYRFTCDTLGEIELFITQLADGPKGAEFEAIFT